MGVLEVRWVAAVSVLFVKVSLFNCLYFVMFCPIGMSEKHENISSSVSLFFQVSFFICKKVTCPEAVKL